jgi:hypothetical protein
MVHIVWLVGALTAVWAIAVMFKPIWLRQSIILVNKGKIVYVIAGGKTVIGIVFLIFATQCNLPGVIITLGILIAGGSILFCLLPFAKIQAFMNWWIAQPFWMYRVWAVAAVLFGGLVMYAGVPK